MFVVQIKFPLRRKQYLVNILPGMHHFLSKNLEDARPYSRRSKANIARSVLIYDIGFPPNAVKIIPLHEAQLEQSKTWKHVLVRAVDYGRNILGL